MNPEVSVVMPVRDGGRWLDDAILSVQRQTKTSYELIVIDDGSRDRSADIVENYARLDPAIRLFRQDRQGIVSALNRGIVESRGEFIARIDSDDVAKPERLDRQVAYLRTHPQCALLGSWADRIDEEGAVTGELTPPVAADKIADLLMRTNPFIHSSIMMRKCVLQDVGLYRAALTGAEDYDLWLRIAEVAGIAILPEKLIQYRVHGKNISRRAQARQLLSTRLAQWSATLRWRGDEDPLVQLQTPPSSESLHALGHAALVELARLFCVLELADASDLSLPTGRGLDLTVLDGHTLKLTHAERRLAQLALINVLKNTSPLETGYFGLVSRLIRLHPARASYLFIASLRDALKSSR